MHVCEKRKLLVPLLSRDGSGTALQTDGGERDGGGEKAERQSEGERLPGDEVNRRHRQVDDER